MRSHATNSSIRGFLFGGLALLTLAGCGGDPIGDPCALTSGPMGFGFDDPCKTKCLQLEDVTCPNGSKVRKAVCAGRMGCDPGGCPSGQICYSFEDPFDQDFYCIPDDICGAPPETAAEGLLWEREARRRSDALRSRFKKLRARSPSEPTLPAVTLEPKPAPAALPAIPPPAAPPGNVLVEAWGADLALVVCLSGTTVATGGDCAKYLPTGTEMVHAGWRLRTTHTTMLECPATSDGVPGVAAEQLEIAPGPGDRWGWVPAAPPSWKPMTLSPLDPALAALVRSQLRKTPENLRLELAALADLDGDPNEERVVRAFYPSADPEKPGHSTLWLIDDDSINPMPTQGMELNGVEDVRGVVPLDSGGALLVFTTEWAGGSGVHVVGPTDEGLGPIAEVACGS